MKEIALVGTNNKVFSSVLSALLENGETVNAMVDYPEHVMVSNAQLTVSRINYHSEEAMREMFEGYHDVVLSYDDNLQDVQHNEIALESFAKTLTAVRKAGASRVIVVAGSDSEAFFTGTMRRLDDIDWTFISTEGDFARKTAEELANARHHREVYE